MYEELVKQLREDGEYADLVAYMHGIRPISPEDATAKIARSWKELFAKAADAIENTSKAYQMIAEAYEAEATKPRWIPATDRLPEEDGMYLVHGKWSASGKKVTDTCEFYVHDGYFRAAWNFNVTHWMPLPTPPKGE